MRTRNIKKKPTAILTADIELRSFAPKCRTDDHWEAQCRKISWLRDLQEKYNCPIFDAGDLFDKKYKSYPSHFLLKSVLRMLPNHIYTIPGNHDLPGKTIDNYSNSAMAVLEESGKLHVVTNPMLIKDIWICGFPWGVEIKENYIIDPGLNVALIHEMIYKDFEPFPGCGGYTAKQILELLPNMDLIVTGHNHQTFVEELDGRILVNPGSLMRNDADQIDHKPCVFLWYGEDNSIEQVFVPIEENVISREHIEEKRDKDERLDAFVEKLGEQTIDGINFVKNLTSAVSSNKIGKQVENKIWKYFEGVK